AAVRNKRARRAKVVKLIFLNIGLFLILVYSVELILARLDPARRLPTNGVVDDLIYTWGHPAVPNRHGFREKEFAEPKPDGLYRIMVLGDSLTWGVGIATEERYTDLLQAQLASENVEVLNFAFPGGPTVYIRDLLAEYIDIVEPDRIVLGFCLNDPQPDKQTYSVERERFEDRYGGAIEAVVGALDKVALLQWSDRVEKGIYGLAERTGVFPPWPEALDRAYEPNSVQWSGFLSALRDIKRMSDDRGLAPPVFAVLNQGVYTDRPTDYAHPDEMLKLYLKWYRQAEAAAAEVGFVTVSFEGEIVAELPNAVLAVNVLDPHPPKELHAIYARKLLPLLRP
ncbi:MAG: SGNH/GDSL hydrolase family protein, partial [Phycisphaerales bacterium]